MIQIIAADGKRRSIRLGKISQRNAEAVKVKVEQLAAAAISGHAIDADTSRWVASLDSVMAEKLANAGLIPKPESATLQEFIDGYIAKRTDVKGATATVYGHTRGISSNSSVRTCHDVTFPPAMPMNGGSI